MYDESLDPNTKPDIYVLNRAWYGVICTGGQAGFALESLADLGRETHPLAFPCLTRDRYIDDLTPGASTKRVREDEISQVLALLGLISFMLLSGVERNLEKMPALMEKV